jgi:hypothetical protein
MNKINFKLLLKKRSQRISFFGIAPSFDWKFILSIGAVLLLIGSIYIGLLYTKILDESLFEVPEVQQEGVSVTEKIQRIENKVEILNQRNQALQVLTTEDEIPESNILEE